MADAKVNLDEETLRTKADYFFKHGVTVHLKFCRGYWKRGNILEMSHDFFTLNEFFDGQMVVFFRELRDIQAYQKREENE